MMPLSPARAATPRSSVVVLLCGLLIMFDGYDLVVFGNVVPSLLAEPGWGLTPVSAGRIASLTLVGMAVGALTAGRLADRFGRRRLVVVSAALFSIMMIVSASAPSLLLFEVSRAVGGLGLGAMFPSATALLVEHTRTGRQALSYSLAFFGYLIGGILAAGLGLLLIQQVGWRVMFWIGAIPLLLVPVLLRYLPESQTWQQFGGSTTDGDGASEGVFSPRYRAATLTIWAVQFCSLLLVGGMVTWLPTMMKALGYSLGAALTFALVLNVGAAIGAVAAAWFADRRGPRFPTAALFLLGAVGLAVLAAQPPLAVAFVLIALAGAGTLGAQILVNTFTASLYPAATRGTGLGWALALGRVGGIIGPVVFGAVLASSFGAVANFVVLALAAVAGAMLAGVLPLTPAGREALAALRQRAAATPSRQPVTQ